MKCQWNLISYHFLPSKNMNAPSANMYLSRRHSPVAEDWLIDHERSTILRMSFYTCHFEKMCLCVTSKNFHVNVIKSLSMSTCHMVSIYSMYYLKIIVEIMKKMDYKYCLLYVHCIFRVIKTAIYPKVNWLVKRCRKYLYK